MDDIFFKRLLDTFKTEAQQHLQQMSNCLARYESTDQAEQRTELIEVIYRAAHSLKGAARAVNMFDIENICKNLEYLFAGIKKEEIDTSPVLFDTIHEALDLISESLLAGDEAVREKCLSAIRTLTPKLNLLYLSSGINENKAVEDSFEVTFSPAPERDVQNSVKENTLNKHEKTQTAGDFVRVDSSKLESLFLKSEQFLSVKLTSEQTALELRNIQASVEEWKREWKKFESSLNKTGSIPGNKGNYNISNFTAFNEWNNQFVSSLSDKLKKLTRSSYQNNRAFGTMVNELVENVKEVMMLPFSNLLDLFPKLVRDLSHDLGKEADLRITGSDIHIDRRILEEIKDPLIHIIRNCIDHGIES
ncbi:MAG: Hpt domain-containing protein, partial [Syntrophothermus sp.]